MDALYWTIRNYLECPREEGQTMVEYALIIALIAIVVIIALQALGGSIGNIFNDIGDTIAGTTGD